MPARQLSALGAILSLVGACAVPAAAEFVVTSSFNAAILGEGNTLRSLAEGLDDPTYLETLDDRTLLCKTAPYVRGQLIMRPGERLVLSATDDWSKRMMFISGDCRWEGCTVENAAWIDAGAGSTGIWRDVTILPGDTHGYCAVWFRSSDLRWEGGLVDCLAAPEHPTPICLTLRHGYIPGPFTNTIREVTFRCYNTFLDDGSGRPGHDLDLTFERCVIETRGDHTAYVGSSPNASEGAASVITFRDCIRRHDGVDAPASSMIARGEIRVTGSASVVRFVEGGKVTETTQEGLAKAGRGEEFTRRLTASIWRLRRDLREASTDVRLRGTLRQARAWMEQLEQMRRGILRVGRYGPQDRAATQSAIALVCDPLTKARELVTQPSPYRPARTALSPRGGEATVDNLDADHIRVRTPHSEWLYRGAGRTGEFATFQPQSRVDGRPVFGGAYPNIGGPSVRYVYPTATGTTHSELPWEPRITRARGRIVGFETQVSSGPALGERVTWVFFAAFPEVALCNVRSLQEPAAGQPLQAPTALLQAYSEPRPGQYNGIRLWNAHGPDGLVLSSHAGDMLPDFPEPEHGAFYAASPQVRAVSKGLVVAQWNGYSHWKVNPPCGYIVRREQFRPGFCLTGGYFTLGVGMARTTPPRDADDMDLQALWFEGAGLGCWENLYNLEDAFSHPCEALLDLTGDDPGRLLLWERAGIARNVEIVCLPGAYGRLESELEWYRGDIAVTLLWGVAAGAEVPIGRLPITVCGEDGRWVVHNGAAPLRDIWLRLPSKVGASPSVNGEAPTATEPGKLGVSVKCDLLAGDNIVTSSQRRR